MAITTDTDDITVDTSLITTDGMSMTPFTDEPVAGARLLLISTNVIPLNIDISIEKKLIRSEVL